MPCGHRFGVGEVAGRGPSRRRWLSTSLRWVWAIRSGACRVEVRPGRCRRSAGGRCPGTARSERAVQHPLHLVTVLDHGADVRVQHGPDAAARRPSSVEPVQVGRAGAASRRRPGAGGCRSRPGRSTADSTRTSAPVGDEAAEDAVDARAAGRGPAVHEHRDETTDGVSWCAASTRAIAAGSAGRKPVRAELGRGEPDLVHLAEHPLRGELVAPAGHLADPPGDGGVRRS